MASSNQVENPSFVMIPAHALSEDTGIFSLNSSNVTRRWLTAHIYRIAFRKGQEFSLASSYLSRATKCSISTCRRFLKKMESEKRLTITHKGSRHVPRSVIVHKYPTNWFMIPHEIYEIASDMKLMSLALELWLTASSYENRYETFPICQKSLATRHGLSRSVVSKFIQTLKSHKLLIITRKATRSEKMKVRVCKGTIRFTGGDQIAENIRMTKELNDRKQARKRKHFKKPKPKRNRFEQKSIFQNFTKSKRASEITVNTCGDMERRSLSKKQLLLANDTEYDFDALFSVKRRFTSREISLAQIKYYDSIGFSPSLLGKIPLYLVDTSSVGFVVDDMNIWHQLKDEKVLPRITRVQMPKILEMLETLSK